MRALVIYESMFGNTRAIAQAVAAGIATRMPVDTFEVSDAPASLPSDVGLLVVGGPTHAHGMSSPKSRADAAERAGERLVSRGSGVREWLDALPAMVPTPAAAFDTRIKGPVLLWGSAAKGLSNVLRDVGLRVVQPPRSFLVGGPGGSLFDRVVDGELDAARAWGAEVAGKVSTGLPA